MKQKYKSELSLEKKSKKIDICAEKNLLDVSSFIVLMFYDEP